MSFESPPPIKDSLIEIYERDWNTGNAAKPREFKTQEFDEVYPDGIILPALTIPRNPEQTIGESGYAFQSNDGPGQRVTGQAYVNLWITSEAAHNLGTRDGAVISPENWIDRARKELARISRQSVISLPGYEHIGWDSGQSRNETDRQPTIFRRLCFIRYSYKVI